MRIACLNIALAILLPLSLPNPASAQTAPTTAAAPAPSDDAAAVKQAGLAFGRALLAGDAVAAQNLATGSDQDRQIVDALANLMSGMRALSDQANTAFGKDAPLAHLMDSNDELTHLYNDQAEAKIDPAGATAIITFGDAPHSPLNLKKVNGLWLIDLSTLQDKAQTLDQLPSLKAMGDAAREVADGIKSGLYKTSTSARAALDAKLRVLQSTTTSQPTP